MTKAIFRFCAIAGLVLGSVAALSAQPRIVSKFGSARVAGRDVVVHVWVVVPPGLDGNEVALEALRGQGARPFQSDEFTFTGLVWDGPADGVPGNDEVIEKRDCLLDTGKCAVIRFIAWTYETGFSGESNGKLYRSCRPCSGAHSRKRRCGRMRSSKLEAIWIS